MEIQKGSSDGEDIPSDFFDDFTKDDFIEGLSVIDSWDNDDSKRPNSRIVSETLDNVKDLRELIARERKEEPVLSKDSTERLGSRSQTHMDDFIKPGSRRDPNKTNEAIKKDKELKVKEYLAKHLESSDNLRPPGTELDDFFEESKNIKKKEQQLEEHLNLSSPSRERRVSPRKSRRDLKYSPQGRKRSPLPRHRNSSGRFNDSSGRFRSSPGRFRSSPGRFRDFRRRSRESPGRFRESPGRFRDPSGKHRDVLGRRHESPKSDRRIVSNTQRRSPKPYSHVRPRRGPEHRSRSPQHFSGYRRERRYSSPQGSPTRTTRRERLSRSPRKQYRRSLSRSPRKTRDEFLYPNSTPTPNYVANEPTFEMEPQLQYPGPMDINYYVGQSGGPIDISSGPLVPQGYNLPQVPAYTGYNVPFEYVSQPPQPVPAPIIPDSGNSGLAPVLHAPQQLTSPVPTNTVTAKIAPTLEPSDALAKLVAEGKLSHEDYLKLAPNKGVVQQMDTNTKVSVLNRCHNAISKLGDLCPPNRLIIEGIKKNESPKSIGPKFCSPLKKKPNTEFNFTKINVSAVALQNKQIIDTIISTLELNNIVGRPKKNVPNNMRDASVQTSNPQCDICVIRKATLVNEVSTSIDPEYFSSTTHTQVVEEDLQNSKSVFNPTGSATDGAPISFAHMTPAQLVSQLVARAKTLKQSHPQPSNQFQGRDQYDGRGGSQNYRNNYNNYRY